MNKVLMSVTLSFLILGGLADAKNEDTFEKLLEKKKIEEALLKVKHISKVGLLGVSNLGTQLVKKMKHMGKERIEVLIALKENNIAIEKIGSVMHVHVDESGNETIKINGQIQTIEELEIVNAKNLSRKKKAKKLRKLETKKSLKLFSDSYSFLGKRELEYLTLNNKSTFKIGLSKDEIIKLSKNKDLILGIELPSNPKDALFSAMLSTNITPFASYGNRGNGINIYMSEGNCPNPGFITDYTRLSGITANHPENVSGIIRGVSLEAFLYCRAGYTLPDPSDPSVEIQSHSWENVDKANDYRINDRDFDNYVFNNNDLIFVAAGNAGNDDINVSSPGKALNVITVGNYNDANDIINNSSGYGNPQTKNQKPELVAPGTNITAGGHVNYTGTSMSTPHAAAFAADFMSNHSSWAKDKPHLLKAIMLAGATKSITGGSDKVGVGGIDFLSTYKDGNYAEISNYNFSYIASRDGGSISNAIELKFNVVNTGDNYRVAISWLNSGDYTYSHRNEPHPIGKDFDLAVYDPSGNYICGSASADNPYEYCDFTSAVIGNYTVRVIQYANRDTANTMSLGVSFNRH